MAALEELVVRHTSPLTGYLFRLTGGRRELAEDIVQETFVQVIQHIGQYTYPKPFKAWLYAIATNRARNHYASADTRRTVAGGDDPLLQDMSPEPETVVEQQEALDEIAMAVMALPDGQREVILLRYTQELTLAEIGEVLDIPEGTVKSRLSLGLKRLRALIKMGVGR